MALRAPPGGPCWLTGGELSLTLPNTDYEYDFDTTSVLSDARTADVIFEDTFDPHVLWVGLPKFKLEVLGQFNVNSAVTTEGRLEMSIVISKANKLRQSATDIRTYQSVHMLSAFSTVATYQMVNDVVLCGDTASVAWPYTGFKVNIRQSITAVAVPKMLWMSAIVTPI